MGQVIQVNGDYNIKTVESGTIKLDTGPGVGEVLVTGNLVVEGDTLTVSAEQLNVADNIITLNDGEIGTVRPGVTLRYAGIEVDRGPSLDKAAFVYDEDVDAWLIGYGTGLGAYNLSGSKIRVRSIETGDTGQDTGDLNLLGAGLGVVNVSGTLNYEAQVTDADDIPNKKYVDDAIQLNPTFQLKRDDTRMIAFDKEDPLDASAYIDTAFPPSDPRYRPFSPYIAQPAESLISVVVDNVINSSFYADRVEIQDLTILDNSIINYNTNDNIVIETNGSGKLETPYAIQINQTIDPTNPGTFPTAVISASLLSAGSPEVGTTGLYFVNTSREGELISKNKALVLSMIF